MEQDLSPELQQRLQQRREQRQRRLAARRRKQRLRFALCILVLAIALGGAVSARQTEEPIAPVKPVASTMLPAAPSQAPEEEAPPAPEPLALGEEIGSQYAVVLRGDTVIAEKDAHTPISPASMTKVLTLLTAVEHIDNLDDTFTIHLGITDYAYVNDCSVVGFLVGETVPIRDLLYGTILPSGADASLALAEYVAGSHEAFVALMNEKAQDLGLSAHFTNCVGLYDPEHLCTISDIARIMSAAMEHPLCREVLKSRTYETAPTPEHPEGQILSNWFLRRIEDKDTGGLEIVGGKTGYVTESGSCAVSAGLDEAGQLYFAATGDASGSWNCIYDHVALYKTLCSPQEAQ